jgi:hypothetical protein
MDGRFNGMTVTGCDLLPRFTFMTLCMPPSDSDNAIREPAGEK